MADDTTSISRGPSRRAASTVIPGTSTSSSTDVGRAAAMALNSLSEQTDASGRRAA